MVAGTALNRRECAGAAAGGNAGMGSVRVWAKRATMLAVYAWIVERMLVGLMAEVGGGPLV